MLMCYVVDKGEEVVAAICTEDLSCISLLRIVKETVDQTGWKRRSLLFLELSSLPIQNGHLAIRTDLRI
jgi:hypothetical protein